MRGGGANIAIGSGSCLRAPDAPSESTSRPPLVLPLRPLQRSVTKEEGRRETRDESELGQDAAKGAGESLKAVCTLSLKGAGFRLSLHAGRTHQLLGRRAHHKDLRVLSRERERERGRFEWR